MSGMWAKIAGWSFAVLSAVPLAIQQATPAGQAQPHGVAQWLGALGGLLVGIGIHHASNSGPSN